jgi:3-hydroxybutyryl-CoA dehydratase
MAAERELVWGYFFEDVEPGARMELGMTLEAANVAAALAAFADPGPNHIDEEHAASGRFGRRVVHGTVSLGAMTSVLGQYFGQSIVALRDLSSRFRAPVYLGDTLRCEWTIVSKEPRDHLAGGGLVALSGVGFVRREGDAVTCLSCDATIAIGSRAAIEPALVERRS